MYEWLKHVQELVEEIDLCIRKQQDESLTLHHLAAKLGYSEFYVSRKFKEISGMSLRDYMRHRKLAFAQKDLRDTSQSLLQIALRYGFSSHEAFTRAFKEAYGVTPSVYRRNPVPVALRTVIKPFDCYLLECGGKIVPASAGEIKTYFVKIPEHKFLHIRNYESIGYFDSGRNKAQFPARTVKRCADCWTVFRVNWTTLVDMEWIAAAGRSWRLSMNRLEEFAAGGFPWRRLMVFGFRLRIKDRFPQVCS